MTLLLFLNVCVCHFDTNVRQVAFSGIHVPRICFIWVHVPTKGYMYPEYALSVDIAEEDV